MNVKIIFISCILFLTLFSCAHETKSLEIHSISENTLRIIEYDRGDTNDTQIAHSSTHFAILDYGVGHSSFNASSAEITLLDKGKIVKTESGEVETIEHQFRNLIDSLNLKQLKIDDLVSRKNDSFTSAELKNFDISKNDLLRDPTRGVSASRNQVKKVGETLFHLTHTKAGNTELSILKDGELTKKTLCTELKINSPCMTFLDITGDGKKELFVFYPGVDYWDAQCFGMDIFDMNEFY